MNHYFIILKRGIFTMQNISFRYKHLNIDNFHNTAKIKIMMPYGLFITKLNREDYGGG